MAGADCEAGAESPEPGRRPQTWSRGLGWVISPAGTEAFDDALPADALDSGHAATLAKAQGVIARARGITQAARLASHGLTGATPP